MRAFAASGRGERAGSGRSGDPGRLRSGRLTASRKRPGGRSEARADAIAGGTTVRTEGRRQVDPADSLTIAAVRVKFEVGEDEDDGEDDLTKAGEFENFVATVDLPPGSFTLANATVVRLVVGTEIKESGGSDALTSLNAVADAIDAGLAVESKGKGVVEATAPLTIVADEVEFRLKN